MLHELGRKRRPPPGDLVGLLLECHGRIRDFARLACDVAASPEAPAAPARDAAGRVRRYFHEALPLHVADEELSILPRLQGRAPDLDRALDAMRGEHAEHAPDVERLVALCGAVEADPGRLAGLAGELGAVASRLSGLFEAHLDGEERLVFPAIGSLLDDAERGAVLAELRGRRR
ncbi:MAG TPA: hemerythrin domain-containing protein [Polyangiaceae bacterium]|nr:hemerythrin domain-containing protein [Polyangiaceae bacterium]